MSAFVLCCSTRQVRVMCDTTATQALRRWQLNLSAQKQCRGYWQAQRAAASRVARALSAAIAAMPHTSHRTCHPSCCSATFTHPSTTLQRVESQRERPWDRPCIHDTHLHNYIMTISVSRRCYFYSIMQCHTTSSLLKSHSPSPSPLPLVSPHSHTPHMPP